MKRIIFALCTLTFVNFANAALIINNGVSGSILNDFDDLSVGSTAGFYTQTGATYGERFAGQTLSGSTFDVLSGLPTTPLTLLAGSSASENIGILFYSGTNTIFGDKSGEIGEGAISILLDSVSDIFGFEALGTGSGNVTTAFFGESGTLLGSFTQSTADAFFGFQVTSGELIKGVSIFNNDDAGMAFDNLTFNASAAGPTPAPAPASLALLGLGLVYMGVRRRKQK